MFLSADHAKLRHAFPVALFLRRRPANLHTANAQAVSPGSEVKIAGPLNFHDLARVVAAGCTLISVVLSLYLIFMHATHYTQPKEQRQ
jgi:hypothetical protein